MPVRHSVRLCELAAAHARHSWWLAVSARSVVWRIESAGQLPSLVSCWACLCSTEGCTLYLSPRAACAVNQCLVERLHFTTPALSEEAGFPPKVGSLLAGCVQDISVGAQTAAGTAPSIIATSNNIAQMSTCWRARNSPPKVQRCSSVLARLLLVLFHGMHRGILKQPKRLAGCEDVVESCSHHTASSSRARCPCHFD